MAVRKVGYNSPHVGRSPFNPAAKAGRTPARQDKRNFSGAGQYLSPPNGPGPGRGPYPWKEPPSFDAVDFSGGGWTTAPGTSHLAEFRFVYGMDALVRGQSDRLGMGSFKIVRESAQSYLQVKFKDGGWAVYWSEPNTTWTAERLEFIFLQMESAQKPGEILWSHLIGVGGTEKWPYATSA